MLSRTKRKLALSPELKAEIACRRYDALSEGQGPLPYETLVKWLVDEHGLAVALTDPVEMQAARKLVERAIRDAFRKGLVGIRKREIIPKYEYDLTLARRLEQRFPAVRKIIVIRPDDFATADPALFYSAPEQLGHAFAAYLSQQERPYGDGERLAIGGGRSVHSAVVALGDMARIEVGEIKIRSLAGSLVPLKTREQNSLMWDADDNALMLASRFAGRVSVEQVQHAIVCSPDERKAVVVGKFFAKPPPEAPAEHAVIGVGILNSNHYLFVDLLRRFGDVVTHLNKEDALQNLLRVPRSEYMHEAPFRPHTEFFEHVHAVVTKSVEVNRSIPDYWPVAETAHSFFFVEPPPSLNLDQVRVAKMRSGFDEILRGLNSWLLSPSMDQLRSIRNLTLLAGSRSTANPLRTLLMHGSRPGGADSDVLGARKLLLPHRLVISAKVAELLLQ